MGERVGENGEAKRESVRELFWVGLSLAFGEEMMEGVYRNGENNWEEKQLRMGEKELGWILLMHYLI